MRDNKYEKNPMAGFFIDIIISANLVLHSSLKHLLSSFYSTNVYRVPYSAMFLWHAHHQKFHFWAFLQHLLAALSTVVQGDVATLLCVVCDLKRNAPTWCFCILCVSVEGQIHLGILSYV